MQSLVDALQGGAEQIVNVFYDELSRLPKSRRILEMLSRHELTHLRQKQVQNLRALAKPRLGAKEHAAMALRVGHIHAIVGLDKEELVRGRGILIDAVGRLIGGSVSARSLALYNRRLNADLAYQIEAYQHIQDAQQQTLIRLTQAVWGGETYSYTSFIDRVIAILEDHEEIAACAIGRPDEKGEFHFEAAAGRDAGDSFLQAAATPSERILIGADSLEGQGAVGRAWRSGKIERIVNFATDPQAVRWRAWASSRGVRSSAVLPIGAPGQRPMAILLLHSTWPGGFLGPHQVGFLEMLETMLGGAIARVGELASSRHMVPIGVRQHWAALVRAGALRMYYQPLLDLRTGKAHKVEALARLQDGDRLLSPGEFIPALASDDLLALYTQGMQMSLAERMVWQDMGVELDMSINLPPAGLNDIRYFNATRAALEQYRCPPARVTLEVLETEALSLSGGQLALLAKFKAMGVLIAQDDLGAGHSGLLRMRELPFDWIKLDRAIATTSGKSVLDALQFVYQLTRLGHSLGKMVVVEGIESADMLKALGVLGVDAAQGYIVGKPMPGKELLAWLARDAVAEPAEDGPLTRLARFLLWEERLLLIAGAPRVAPILARADLQQRFIHAVLNDARDSAAYADARQQLIAAILARDHTVP